MSAEPEERPSIDGAETSIAAPRKPFREDDLCVVIRAQLTRASDLRAVAESEIARVNSELRQPLGRCRRVVLRGGSFNLGGRRPKNANGALQ